MSAGKFAVCNLVQLVELLIIMSADEFCGRIKRPDTSLGLALFERVSRPHLPQYRGDIATHAASICQLTSILATRAVASGSHSSISVIDNAPGLRLHGRHVQHRPGEGPQAARHIMMTVVFVMEAGRVSPLEEQWALQTVFRACTASNGPC